jgi:hypothetical protein
MTFRTIQYLSIICTILMTACATGPTTTNNSAVETPSLAVHYLRGQMLTSSPDGATPYGPAVEVLAKRTTDLARGEIVEDSWHGKEHHKTFFRLRAGTLVFDVSDEKKTFEGTVTFQTRDWLRGSVSYDIKMLDHSGTITGTGTWAGDTYSTNKLFSDPTGTPRARMTETLKIVAKEDFLASIPK